MPSWDHSGVDSPSRRAVLATGGVLALSACLPGSDPEPSRPDPDLVLRRRAAADVRELVAAYAAVVAAHPGEATQLEALAAEHEAHVLALAPPAASGTPTAAPPSSAARVVPTTVPAARRWLIGMERSAARRRTRQSLKAGADLARLLAAVAAAETTHAALLERP